MLKLIGVFLAAFLGAAAASRITRNRSKKKPKVADGRDQIRMGTLNRGRGGMIHLTRPSQTSDASGPRPPARNRAIAVAGKVSSSPSDCSQPRTEHPGLFIPQTRLCTINPVFRLLSVQESVLEHSSQSNQDRLGGKHGKERRRDDPVPW